MKFSPLCLTTMDSPSKIFQESTPFNQGILIGWDKEANYSGNLLRAIKICNGLLMCLYSRFDSALLRYRSGCMTNQSR